MEGSTSMSGQRQPTIFCAWCRRVIQWGDTGISHGLCETCLPTVAAELEARLESEPPPQATAPGAERGKHLFSWW
ncbi:MAG: hypothetical protein IT303_13450 [Dehalococcoidia bacterium]|nr:hypothetical protein [Dehalococcoidia bacterium]